MASERLGRGLGDRVMGRFRRERLAQHGRDPVEAPLDLRLARALAQEPARVDGDRRLVRDCLRERDLGGHPDRRLGAVQGEHADQSPERHDRGREHAPHAAIDQVAHVPERRVAHFRRVEVG